MGGLASKSGVRSELQTFGARAENQHQARATGTIASMLHLQRAAGNQAVTRLLAADSGRPLDPGIRAQMEARFGWNFDNVRVHAGAGAADAAKDLSAKAITVGTHIAFASGRFAPDTTDGRRLR
jgi:hypothetical protein